MGQNEFQRTINGTSIANRRRGLKAHRTSIENQQRLTSAFIAVGAVLAQYDEFQKETYGGIVERTVLRTPLRADLGKPEVIPFHQAQSECSGWAEVRNTGETDFEGFEGKQIRYLLTLDAMFMYPSLTSAFGEVFDAGCAIRTNKAEYTLSERSIKN